MPNVYANRALSPADPFDPPPPFASLPPPPVQEENDVDIAGAPASTIEVLTLFRGIGTGARLLPHPERPDRHAAGTRLLLGGLALVAFAISLFAFTAADIAVERRALDRMRESGRERAASLAPRARSAALDVLFVGALLGGVALAGLGLRRRGKARAGFLIGSGAGVDAPVDPAYLPSSVHPLIAAAGGRYVLNATARMRGEITAGGHSYPLDALIEQQGPSFALPPGGEARLDCGETTFLISATTPPRKVAAPLVSWNRSERAYALGSAAAVGLFMVMIMFIPADPQSLSTSAIDVNHRWVTTRIRPPVEAPPPPAPGVAESPAAGTPGKAHAGPEGTMGNPTSRDRNKAISTKGPQDNQNPVLARKVAADLAANAGILGILKRDQGGVVASIFGEEQALGKDAETYLGNLVGNQFGNAYGGHGLGVVGTGAGGGDTGRGTLGTGELNTIGRRGNGGGPGYGRNVGPGALHGRETIKVPGVMTGGHIVSRGSLDKEIIRRTVRRHLNEVRFCYEQQLSRNPNLAGRLMVQFTINAQGQVISSVLASSTMHNAHVESCTLQAVRRWAFPQPAGGGLVIVSYPFMLAPAGAGV